MPRNTQRGTETYYAALTQGRHLGRYRSPKERADTSLQRCPNWDTSVVCVLLAPEPSIVEFFPDSVGESDAMSDIVGLLLEAAPVRMSRGCFAFGFE